MKKNYNKTNQSLKKKDQRKMKLKDIWNNKKKTMIKKREKIYNKYEI